MKKLLEKLLSKWLEKPLRKLARQIKKLGAQSSYPAPAQEKEADGPGADVESKSSSSTTSAHADAGEPSSLPWSKCRLASCWDGDNAEKRFMNMLSPKFDDKKFGDYLAWTIAKGCDHVHVFLINEGDGEGAGYDCCTDSKANAVALERVRLIRAKGLGVVFWVVADDSPNYRAKLFANPAKYAKGAKNLLPYASAIVVGLEMNEGKPAPSVDQWKSVRSAFKSFANVPFGVHHTSGNEFKYASVGDFICGQLDPSASVSDIKKQITAIRAKGKEAVGFEYERKPNRMKAQAALDAGAHAVGNWDGNANSATTMDLASTNAEDAVDYSQLSWCYGGFKGGSAKLDSSARIYNLQVKSDCMSYTWLSGGCENLGASSRQDYNHTVACLFILVSGRWYGGKIDWISTSRSTRDFKNVKEGYCGWPTNSIAAAEKFAFVIVGADGKRRTNVITCGR